MNIFFLDQIVETTENKLLTWGQIKKIRGVQAKGKRPKWFKRLENQALENEDQRTCTKEYRHNLIKGLEIKVSLGKISQDLRRKE